MNSSYYSQQYIERSRRWDPLEHIIQGTQLDLSEKYIRVLSYIYTGAMYGATSEPTRTLGCLTSFSTTYLSL